MKALLLHCKNYRTRITKLSNRPIGIVAEDVNDREQSLEDCLVVLLTIEKKDKAKSITSSLAGEIIKTAKEVGVKDVVLLPFAHLSSQLADSQKCIEFFDNLVIELNKKVNIMRSHFGSHKELLLDLYGHPGNARFREF